MRHWITSPQNPNWRATSHEILRLLGVTRLPVEGMTPREIAGIKVWVNPLPERPAGIRHKRSTHRVMAECPSCKAVLSVGRLFQHRCGRKPTVEQARRAFLLVMARRSDGEVSRHYLEEKVKAIYGDTTAAQVRGRLDLPSQKLFDEEMAR